MANPGAGASLMDDVDFLTELEKFDSNPIVNERIPSASLPGDPDPEWTWETRATFDQADGTEAQPSHAAPTSVRQIALGVGGFLLMMCLGGAAAALIFHDRVAQLLR